MVNLRGGGASAPQVNHTDTKISSPIGLNGRVFLNRGRYPSSFAASELTQRSSSYIELLNQ